MDTASYVDIINKTPSQNDVRREFLDRIALGAPTRDENPKSHFCTYFPAVDRHAKQVFMGLHIKSGLWLFNGGHIDRRETPEEAVTREMREEWGVVIGVPAPSLLTITPIENPKKQVCEVHYDIWYFMYVDSRTFSPDARLLATEFTRWGWKSADEARSLIRNKETGQALALMESLFQ